MYLCFWSLYDLDEVETCEHFSVSGTRRMMHGRRASYFLTGRVEWVQGELPAAGRSCSLNHFGVSHT